MAIPESGRVFGLYPDFPSLRAGVDTLKALRFTNHDISVLFSETAVAKTFEAEDDPEPESADSSAFIGGPLGLFTYVRPEREGVIADALVTLGVAPRRAGLYEDGLRSGSLLLCIRSSSTAQFDDAAAALVATGAESVQAARPLTLPEKKRAIPHDLHRAEHLFETVFAS